MCHNYCELTFPDSEWVQSALERSPPIVPYSVIMDTPPESVRASHSSSPSVKSRLQHLNLFPDYIFVTLSTPSPPNRPSLRLLLFILHLFPFFPHPSPPLLFPAALLRLLPRNVRLISPHLPLSRSLLLFSSLRCLLLNPSSFLPAQFCLRLFTSIVPPDGLC